MRNFLFFLFCGICFSASGQDLTGIWRGSFSSNSSKLMEMLGQDDRYKLEVQLDQHDKAFSGVTYSYKTTLFYGKASCEGSVNLSTKKVFLEELKIIEVRMVSGVLCIMTYFLQYNKVGDEEFLEGKFNSMNVNDSSRCGGGTVFLRRVTTSDFHKEPFLVKREKEKSVKKDSLPLAKNTPPTPGRGETINKEIIKKPISKKNLPQNDVAKKNSTARGTPPKKTGHPYVAKTDALKTVKDSSRKMEKGIVPVTITPKVLTNRENELVKTITTSANEITINIYDNGTIDNDTVSVYLDKKLVISKERLTEMPITVKFKLDNTNAYHELVMVAENLGEIPPNTSLMVVNAGNQQYEVRITSTEQKNAVVIFKYDENQ